MRGFKTEIRNRFNALTDEIWRVVPTAPTVAAPAPAPVAAPAPAPVAAPAPAPIAAPEPPKLTLAQKRKVDLATASDNARKGYEKAEASKKAK